MIQILKLGDDFTKSIKLNLLPGVILAKGYWQSDVRFHSVNKQGITEFNHGTFNHGGEPSDFDVIVASDVREITFMCYRHNSFPGHPNTYLKYTMRVDHLILLNFAYRLAGTTIKF